MIKNNFNDALHSMSLSEDGSFTAYSKEYGEHYHSTKDGALYESLIKHVIPALTIQKDKEELNIYSIAVVPGLKGYILLEADNEITVRRGITDTPHIRGSGIVKGAVNIEELSGMLEAKPLMKTLEEGQTIEIISGMILVKFISMISVLFNAEMA